MSWLKVKLEAVAPASDDPTTWPEGWREAWEEWAAAVASLRFARGVIKDSALLAPHCPMQRKETTSHAI